MIKAASLQMETSEIERQWLAGNANTIFSSHDSPERPFLFKIDTTDLDVGRRMQHASSSHGEQHRYAPIAGQVEGHTVRQQSPWSQLPFDSETLQRYDYAPKYLQASHTAPVASPSFAFGRLPKRRAFHAGQYEASIQEGSTPVHRDIDAHKESKTLLQSSVDQPLDEYTRRMDLAVDRNIHQRRKFSEDKQNKISHRPESIEPAVDISGIAYTGPRGTPPVLPERNLVVFNHPHQASWSSTKPVEVPSVPHMRYSDVDNLLRGYPGRLSKELRISFPDSSQPVDEVIEVLPRPDPYKKLFGPQGVLARGNKLDAPPRNEPRPSPLHKIGELASRFVGKGIKSHRDDFRRFRRKKLNMHETQVSHSEAPPGLKCDSPRSRKTTDNFENNDAQSLSVTPGDQMWIFARVEFLLTTSTNHYLLLQKDADRVSPESIQRLTSKWSKQNRPQPKEFMFDFASQFELISANIDRFVFFGSRANSRITKSTLLNSWRSLSRDLSNRTYCVPDAALKRIIVDAIRVLEMLGAADKAFMELHDIQEEIKVAMACAHPCSSFSPIGSNAYAGSRQVASPLLMSPHSAVDDDDDNDENMTYDQAHHRYGYSL